MRNVCLIAFAMMALPLCSGRADSADSSSEEVEIRMERAAHMLASRDDADSLAAAGLLTLTRSHGLSLRLMEQATAIAPERTDLVWLQIRLCQAEQACDSEPVEEHLRFLDVHNGAGWLGALARAAEARDEQTKLAALAAISRSERVDIYWTTIVARLSRATAETEVVSLTEAETYVIGSLSALAIPAYQILSNACKGESLKHGNVVEVCRGIANALQNGDTYITEMMGVAIAERVWPENSLQWKAAIKARRSWQDNASYLSQADAWNATHTEEFLDLCHHYRREQDVFMAAMGASGKNPDPPSN